MFDTNKLSEPISEKYKFKAAMEAKNFNLKETVEYWKKHKIFDVAASMTNKRYEGVYD